jgi:hypothetical protein
LAGAWLNKLGKNAKKKLVSLGFSMLSRKALTTKPAVKSFDIVPSTANADLSRHVA